MKDDHATTVMAEMKLSHGGEDDDSHGGGGGGGGGDGDDNEKDTNKTTHKCVQTAMGTIPNCHCSNVCRSVGDVCFVHEHHV